MPNKSQRNWTEIDLAIAAAAVTATLGLWSAFSAPDPSKTAQVVLPASPTLPPPSETSQPAPAALPLRPVKIIYGGQAPVQQVVQVEPAVAPKSAPVNVARVVAAPLKPASTGSSKP